MEVEKKNSGSHFLSFKDEAGECNSNFIVFVEEAFLPSLGEDGAND